MRAVIEHLDKEQRRLTARATTKRVETTEPPERLEANTDEVNRQNARPAPKLSVPETKPVMPQESLDEKLLDRYINQVSQRYKSDDEFLSQVPTQAEMQTYLQQLCKELEVPLEYRTAVIEDILTSIYDYHVITPLMKLDGVTSIQIYGDHSIKYRRFGEWHVFDQRFRSYEDVVKFIDQKLKHTPYHWSPMDPSVDAILQDGSRLHVKSATSGITVDAPGGKRVYPCPIITIRRFLHPFRLSDLRERGSMNEQMEAYLSILPQVGASFIVVGGQEMGKTTTLNALTEFFPNRFISAFIEEAAEMQPQCENAVRLWNRPDNGANQNAITMDQNVIDLLRMAADIGVVGEIRSPQVMYEFLNVSNLGMFLVAATLHASSAYGAIRRMVSLGLSSKEHPHEHTLHMQIADGISHIIVLKRSKGRVGVGQIAEVTGLNERLEVQLRDVFLHNIDTGAVAFNGISQQMLERMETRGVACPDILKGSEEDCN